MQYRVRVARGESQFEVEGDKAFVLQLLKKYEAGGIQVGEGIPASKTKIQPSAPVVEPSVRTGKSLSAGEFIRQCGVKRHIDLVWAFCYYLEKYSGLKDFSAADINNCYYEAKLESSNTSQFISMHIRSANVMEAKGGAKGGKKKYMLTRTGIESFESKFIAKKAK